MNRSAVRTTAIRRMVAAGLLIGFFSLSGPAVAAADQGGVQGGHSGPSRDGAQQSVASVGGPQAGRRQDRPVLGAGPVTARGRLSAVVVAESDGGGLPVAPTRRMAPTTLLPEAQVLRDGLIELDPQSLPVQTFPVPTPGMTNSAAISVSPPIVVLPSAPVLIPGAGPVEPALHATMPQAVGQHPPVGAHLPSRVSVTADLAETPLGELVLLALPGVAVLVGVTAVGIMMGHRNAKSAYVLQSMGTTRFLS